MGNLDAIRVETGEGGYTFLAADLANLIKEIDQRIALPGIYDTFTRTDGVITKVEYFSDVAKTQKILKREYSYAANKRITSWVSTYYNLGGTSTDCTVTTTLTRTDDKIVSSTNIFYTEEDSTI